MYVSKVKMIDLNPSPTAQYSAYDAFSSSIEELWVLDI